MMMASTHTISIRVKPASPLASSARPAGDVGRGTGPAFLPVSRIGDDVIAPVLSRRAIDVRVAPGIERNQPTFEIWPVPGGRAARALHQRGQALGRVRITADVEEIEVERARE